ncbi:hypothetical protein SKAU_G00219930 [Synaphobranchus kaupii]|uniref:Uncharacterized protein n=1 Tax=Synaphobranchus kaupii TaxID=118154 RepID=A0A9Q1FB34_SYNKA|nr:hypothetical protein SKAU_G00219930 [Synaphobranchus kaupii]
MVSCSERCQQPTANSLLHGPSQSPSIYTVGYVLNQFRLSAFPAKREPLMNLSRTMENIPVRFILVCQCLLFYKGLRNV